MKSTICGNIFGYAILKRYAEGQKAACSQEVHMFFAVVPINGCHAVPKLMPQKRVVS